ncbi:hypothetical protein, partial [Amycolatopsis decaplanina]
VAARSATLLLVTHEDLYGDAQLSTLAILRRCADEDLWTEAGAAAVSEYIVDVRDRFPADSPDYLTGGLVTTAFTLLQQLAMLTGETEHGLIDRLALAFHPDLTQPMEAS